MPTMLTSRMGGASKMVEIPAIPKFVSVVLIFSTVSTFTFISSTKWLSCQAFTTRPSPTSFPTKTKPLVATTAAMTKTKTVMTTPFFFAEESAKKQQQLQSSDTENDELVSSQALLSSSSATTTSTRKQQPLFDDSTLAEANDALKSVGWGGMTFMNDGDDKDEDAALTSDDPFVQRIDASIREETGVGLDELLNPAKVVNLERELYNLRNELATLTGVDLQRSPPTELTTAFCDGGGGGEAADMVRTKIAKKEKDLFIERKSVFRSWLKNVFLGQAVLSTALSYVMATNPDSLFGSFDWYRNISNMDTSISVLGFWWWWLFIVPSLRSRRPTGNEKRALDMAFLGTPLISLLSPVVTKDTGLIWMANFLVVAGSYGYAFWGSNDDDNDDEGENGEDDRRPGWLKFIYKSLDFGSGRERGARK